MACREAWSRDHVDSRTKSSLVWPKQRDGEITGDGEANGPEGERVSGRAEVWVVTQTRRGWGGQWGRRGEDEFPYILDIESLGLVLDWTLGGEGQGRIT